jgi:hypothetical protein
MSTSLNEKTISLFGAKHFDEMSYLLVGKLKNSDSVFEIFYNMISEDIYFTELN